MRKLGLAAALAAASLTVAGCATEPYGYGYSPAAQERHARVSLQELARVLGLLGKPAGIDGSQVETFANEGRFAEIADYCRSDVVNTYRAWLRYELFCGRLSEEAHGESETMLASFLDGRS